MHIQRAILTVLVVAFFLTASYHLFHLFMGDYYITQAEEIEKSKDWNTAIDAYRKAIDYTPGNPEYHLLLGWYYLRFGQAAKDKAIKGKFLRKAKDRLQEARNSAPKDARIYLALAQTSEVLSALRPKRTDAQESNEIVPGTLESTETYYREAVSLYPSNTQYRYLLASYLKGGDKVDEALRELQNIITADPGALRYVDRNPFWDIPDLERAIENSLNEALNNRYTRKGAASALISRLVKEQKWMEAASLCKEHVKPQASFSDRTSYYLKLGRYLLQGGAEKDAESNFLRAFEATSDQLQVLRSVVGTYEGVCRFNELFALLEKLKGRHPEVIEIDFYRVQLLYRQKRYEDAYSDLEGFLTTKENPEAHYWMAVICKELERPYEAEIHIKQAIKWKPENAEYRDFYATLLHKAWRFSEAVEQADAAIQASHGKNPSYLDRKAQILYKMNRYEDALQTWKKAAQLTPGQKGFQRNIEMAAKAANLASTQTE